jgi:uncharacterized protein YecE (DUF72 family)
MTSSLRIGTAGWSYPHWNGVVYPKTTSGGFHPLEFLAERLDAIEINSSFYQTLKPEITSVWSKKVSFNPHFQFSAKLHRRFTHDRILDGQEIAAFKAGLFPLLRGKKFAALLMQFPWSYRFTPENQEFLIRLRRAFHEFPLVAEMRHSSWLAEEAIGTFLDYKIGFCNIDQPEYTSAMPPTSYLTNAIGYVRLHGRNPNNALGGFDRNAAGEPSARLRQHDYLYSEAELEQWKIRIDRIARFAETTMVIFNNDACGKSVVNALQLQTLHSGHAVSAPRELRRKFPMELEHFRSYEQQYLFPAA